MLLNFHLRLKLGNQSINQLLISDLISTFCIIGPNKLERVCVGRRTVYKRKSKINCVSGFVVIKELIKNERTT